MVAAAENSEVSLFGSVAVAVMISPAGAANGAVKLTLPPASVVSFKTPRRVKP